MDLDRGGFGFQRVRTYLGPTLGWKDELVSPSTDIITGGIHLVQPGESLLLVDVAAAVQINLPDVVGWFKQTADQPATGFERSITIKDIGGNAANFNIVVAPFGQQAIDNIQTSLVISEARANVKLIPLLDLTGWMVETAIGAGGTPGGGDVLKAGNNTFTGINTFNNTVTVPTVGAADNSQNAATTAWVASKNYLVSVSLAPYALIASPIFTGDPQAPTPSPGDNDTSIATTAFVQAAIGAIGTPAPVGAEYITASVNATLTAERVLTNTASITWDFSTPGQAKASTSAGGGNVSNSGTPVNGQFARWVTGTTIEGINPSVALTAIGAQPADGTLTGLAALNGGPGDVPYFTGTDTFALQGSTSYGRALLGQGTGIAVVNYIGAQPLDADLTAIAALGGTNTIYYRSAPDIWSPVTFSGLSFSGGVLTVTAGGGNVSNSGTPTAGQVALWTDATHIQGVATATLGFQPLDQDLTDIAAIAGVRGDIIIRGASAWQKLAAGTSGQVLQTQGAAADPLWATPAAGGAATISEPQGRLTLATATPVMTVTVAGATTIFYTPYVGNQCPIYNGTSFAMTAFAELSNVTTASSVGSAGPAVVAANTNYDLFVWSNAGTPTLTRGSPWTSPTARGTGVGTTELIKVNGVWLNAVAIANGPAAQRGTYVGTVRSNATSTIDYQLGSRGANGGAGIIGVWNCYNRVNVLMRVQSTTTSYTYNSVTIRNAQNSATWRISFVAGLEEDQWEAWHEGVVGASADGIPNYYVGYDGPGATGAWPIYAGVQGSAQLTVQFDTKASIVGSSLGFHYVQAGENVNPVGAAAPTFYGGDLRHLTLNWRC